MKHNDNPASKDVRNFLQMIIADFRRYHFVFLAALASPLILLSTFFLFPVLEIRNLGWTYFHLGCYGAFGLSLGGLIAWFVEQRYREHWYGWFAPFVFIGMMGISVWYRVAGEFYWAFDRGYFLD